jgi:PHD/YefM family antitoxin component YafN of YafNO toxin-antitoxin module
MKMMEISEATAPLSVLTHDLEEEMLVLTSKDKPVAALISLKNVDKESLALSSSHEFMKIIDTARKEFAAGKTVSLEEMKREFLPEKKKRKR